MRARKGTIEKKSVFKSFRLTPSFCDALVALANRDMRTQSGMLEVIMRDYLTRHPLEATEPLARTAAKKTTKRR